MSLNNIHKLDCMLMGSRPHAPEPVLGVTHTNRCNLNGMA